MWIQKIFYSHHYKHVEILEIFAFYAPIHLFTAPTTTATIFKQITLT